jgi:hypothetical protein
MQSIFLFMTGLAMAGMLLAGVGFSGAGLGGVMEQLPGREDFSPAALAELVRDPGAALEKSESIASFRRFIDGMEAAFADPDAPVAPQEIPDAGATSLESLADRFQRAGQSIEDPDSRAYYDRLMRDLHPSIVNEDTPGLAGQLPDIEEISKQSLIAPLQQAGEGITDPEMKSHYERMMGEIGLENK